MLRRRARRAPGGLPGALLGLASVTLLAGMGGALWLGHPSPPARQVTLVRGRLAPPAALDAQRVGAVRALLHQRAEAMRSRNRDAWLATVEPGTFRARQAALFDALAQVPLADWTYRLDPSVPSPARADLDRLRGPGWWAPGVTLTYRLRGYDTAPTVETQYLTFVPRRGGWLLAADDDFAATGHDTTRGLWDGGPVTVVRGQNCMVLGHPAATGAMAAIATAVDAAIPRVSAIWGTAWSRRVVVLVPSSQQEMARVVGQAQDFSQIAAVATAELSPGGPAGPRPVGNRIVVNPGNFAKLGVLGRRVVLTHEVTHVATRDATGPAAPAWLVEGFADYVGYSGLRVPYAISAAELRSAVRAGQLPTALPSDADFDAGKTDLAQVYEEAWIAVTLLADEHGRDGLLRFYRTVGRGGAPTTAVADAFRGLWGTSTAAFVADWRRDLTRVLR